MTLLKSSDETNDIEKLDNLIEVIYQDLTEAGGRFKIMELLKAMEFKRKIAPPDDREGAFWNMIDEIRASELSQSSSQNPIETNPPAPKKCKVSNTKKGYRNSQ